MLSTNSGDNPVHTLSNTLRTNLVRQWFTFTPIKQISQFKVTPVMDNEELLFTPTVPVRAEEARLFAPFRSIDAYLLPGRISPFKV